MVEGEQSGEYKLRVQPERSINKDRELGPGKEWQVARTRTVTTHDGDEEEIGNA